MTEPENDAPAEADPPTAVPQKVVVVTVFDSTDVLADVERAGLGTPPDYPSAAAYLVYGPEAEQVLAIVDPS